MEQQGVCCMQNGTWSKLLAAGGIRPQVHDKVPTGLSEYDIGMILFSQKHQENHHDCCFILDGCAMCGFLNLMNMYHSCAASD